MHAEAITHANYELCGLEKGKGHKGAQRRYHIQRRYHDASTKKELIS